MTPALALVTVLTLVAVGVYLWRGWRDLNRAQHEFQAHVEQALAVIDEDDT